MDLKNSVRKLFNKNKIVQETRIWKKQLLSVIEIIFFLFRFQFVHISLLITLLIKPTTDFLIR